MVPPSARSMQCRGAGYRAMVDVDHESTDRQDWLLAAEAQRAVPGDRAGPRTHAQPAPAAHLGALDELSASVRAPWASTC